MFIRPKDELADLEDFPLEKMEGKKRIYEPKSHRQLLVYVRGN